MENRYLQFHDIKTRSADGDDLIVEGYFAVFDEVYEVWPGVTESIQRGAFANSIGQDVRALYNHNTDQILGRTSAGTLELKEDDRGLWGRIKINRNDSDAVNVYERIARGDITGCSFGFEIKSERWEQKADNSVHYTIEEVDPLYEVSPCVFPAYEATSVSSRGKDLEEIRKRTRQAWRDKMLNKLKGGAHGTEGTGAPEKD